MANGEWSEVGNFADHGVPNGVVFWLRVPAPGRDIPLLGTLLGVGSMLDPSEVLNRQLGPSLSRGVDLSKPIDLTVSGLDDDPAHLALAAGVLDSKAFVGQLGRDFRIVPKSRGRWLLLPKAKSAQGELGCELWHAPEPVGVRLLCATEPPLIEQQGEFLMAAARASVNRSNFHAELPGRAAQALLEKSAEQQAPKRDQPAQDSGAHAGRELGHQMVLDWARELSGFSWDLTLQQNSVEVSQTMGLSRSESLFSTSLSGRVGAPRPVPDAFWQLPNDSDGALYSEGAEPEPMRKHAVRLTRTLRTSMEKDDEFEYPRAVLDQVERSIQSLLLRGGGFEIAYGQDLDRAAQVLNEAAEHTSARGARSGSADLALSKARGLLGGWALIGIEDDSHAYLQALREALRFAQDKTQYPRKKGAKSGAPSTSTNTFRELPVPASAGLPADALHVLVRSAPNPKYLAAKAKPAPPAASAYHVFGVPDSERHVWFAISTDQALALARLQAVLSPVPAKTLGASEELRQLAKQPLAGLGFGSLAGLSGPTLSADSRASVLESQRTLKQMWALPKRGATRLPIWIHRAQAAGGQRRVVVNLRLSPDAIGDLLALFLAKGADAAVDGE